MKKELLKKALDLSTYVKPSHGHADVEEDQASKAHDKGIEGNLNSRFR